MKLVFIITDINYGGGGERVLITLSNYFVSTYNYKISIISLLKTSKKNPYKIDERIDVHYLEEENSSAKKSRLIRGIQKVLKIKTLKIKLNHIFQDDLYLGAVIGIGFENSWYLPILKIDERIKKIGTQHTSYIEFDKKNIIEKLVWKLFLSKLSYFLVLSKDTEEYFIKKLRLKNIIEIPNPNPYELTTENYKKEKIVICVGRLSKEKQVHHLIEIWNRILFKENWKLLILGDGEEKVELEKQVNRLGLNKSIEFLGTVSNLEEYYKKASIIVSTSCTESFSMVLIEALTFNICPIFYDCPTGPRTIIKNNINGFLVELNNKEEMVRKLEKVISEIELGMGVNCKESSELKKYSLENIGKKWQKLF